MTSMLRRFAVALFFGIPLLAQLPDYYKTVDRLVWVVDDLDKSIQGWRKLGFTDMGEAVEADVEVVFRGKPARAAMRTATGLLGDAPVHWVQPLGGDNAYREFLSKHGSGVFSLVHRVPSAEVLEQEVARLKGLGVGVLQSGSIDSGAGAIRYVFLDTAAQGKYVLGLLHVPGPVGESPLAAPPNTTGRKVVQYAFVARDLTPVSEYWRKLGWPEMEVTHGTLRDMKYHGRQGVFDHKLGWQRHGSIVYEWIWPLKGPTVYFDHMEKHGEGVQHLAFNVDDIFKESERWTALGFPTTQSGAWGEKDKAGSGRFAYQDAHPIGGIDIELLWSYK